MDEGEKPRATRLGVGGRWLCNQFSFQTPISIVMSIVKDPRSNGKHSKRNYEIRHDRSEILAPYEIFWRDRCSLFEKHGYRLRPRFRPGWVPSWYTNDVYKVSCEDNLSGTVSHSHSITPGIDADAKRY